MTRRPHVIIIGGGLAGLAAAVGLAPHGWRVTLYESRPRLGGRASSFADATTGQLVDACQHVSMGCCTSFHHFCTTVGIDGLLERQSDLYFLTPDGRVSRWNSDHLPAPLHFTRSFLRAHYLTWTEKLKIGTALVRLWLLPPGDDEPFLDWLRRHDQDDHCVARFWSVVLTSALNESIDRVGTRYARQVFVEGFLRTRRGGEVSIPRVPLVRLYGAELHRWLERYQVEVRISTGVRQVLIESGHATGLLLRSGERVSADAFILAVPSDRMPGLIPPAVLKRHDDLRRAGELETSPITSAHFWHNRPITNLPHAVLLDLESQWLFNRGEVAPGRFYTQVVVSASRSFAGLRNEEILARIGAELRQVFPAARDARLLHERVVTERSATFSVTPGVDQLRPPQRTSVRGLYLAGDWTRTGWPATMEGAVRSGYLAAEAVLHSHGTRVRLVRPPL